MSIVLWLTTSDRQLSLWYFNLSDKAEADPLLTLLSRAVTVTHVTDAKAKGKVWIRLSFTFAKIVQSEISVSILPTTKWRTCCWISRTISNLTKSILTRGHLNFTTGSIQSLLKHCIKNTFCSDFHVQFACSVPQSELLLSILVTPSGDIPWSFQNNFKDYLTSVHIFHRKCHHLTNLWIIFEYLQLPVLRSRPGFSWGN